MSRLKATVIKLTLGLAVILGGCAVVPADGYYYGGYSTYGVAPYGERYVTSDGVNVVYDYDPGIYRVVSYPGLYWWNGYYYRERGGHWERSHRHNGPWVHRPVDRVPSSLRRGYAPRHRPPPHELDRKGYKPSYRYRARPYREHVEDRRRVPNASRRPQPEQQPAFRDTHARRDWRRAQGPNQGVPARRPTDRPNGSYPQEHAPRQVTRSSTEERVERSWARVRNQSKHVSRPPADTSKNDRYRNRFLQTQ
jgi:hypothetical protein